MHAAGGNSGAPLDYRPVVLLPMLYRMWMRVRARELDRWMKVAGLGDFPGRTKGAEEGCRSGYASP